MQFYLDMALTIVQHPKANGWEKAFAGWYIATEGTAHVAAVVGSGIAAWAPLAPAAGVAEAACADGDCTNEVNAVAQSGLRLAQTANSASGTIQSVWSLNPFQRGQAIENMLGRSSQLTQNFPVIDRFENGVATSIKSIDLAAKTYQNVDALKSVVTGYVDKMANYQGQARAWGGVRILPWQITGRAVDLAIPSSGVTKAQLDALLALQRYAQSVGVTLNIIPIQ